MTRAFTRSFLPICLAALLCADSSVPEKMMKMVVLLRPPGPQASSESAQLKTIYRAGAHYARIEDAPDPEQRMQKVTIIAEPDAYSANLIDRKGTHAIDQGSPDDLHLPIVLPFDPKHKLGALDKLEFGNEFAFFEAAGATKEPGPNVAGKPTDSYALKIPEGIAKLTVRAGTQIPVSVSWHTTEGTYRYEYQIYAELPFDPAKFTKPAGVAFTEIPPDKTGER